jgi:hypothetical protein
VNIPPVEFRSLLRDRDGNLWAAVVDCPGELVHLYRARLVRVDVEGAEHQVAERFGVDRRELETWAMERVDAVDAALCTARAGGRS